MIDLSRFLGPGTGVWWSQAAAEPEPLVHALIDQVPGLGPVSAFVGLTWNERITRDPPPELAIYSYGGLGDLRRLSRQSRLHIVPCHYSSLPRMFAERRLPSDVGFVQVSPPDRDGTCSLGLGVDYASDAIASTPVLIAEINQRMPSTRGSGRIPLERFAAIIETDRPLLEIPDRSGGEVEQAIARHVSELVGDGDTIQMGIGSIPSAVMAQLTGHRHLGLHSGMVSDGVLDLIDKGVIDGSRKEIDRGVAVAGAALGSTALYEGIVDAPIEFRPASYTHAPAVLSKLASFVAINSAIEVDLTGQVGAEIRQGVHVGSVGGQADFSKAASLTGARSIIALRSTWHGQSTIKAELDSGTVTTARAEVDFVVTEHGAAELRGCDVDTRVRRLIAVAAPEHREALARSFSVRPDGVW